MSHVAQMQSPITHWPELRGPWVIDLSCPSSCPGPGRDTPRWRWLWKGPGLHPQRQVSCAPFLRAGPSCFGSRHFCCQRTKCFLVRQKRPLGKLDQAVFLREEKRLLFENSRGLAFLVLSRDLLFLFWKACSLPQFLATEPGGISPARLSGLCPNRFALSSLQISPKKIILLKIQQVI